MGRTPEINVFESPAELFQAGAAQFVELANAAVKDHGKFSVALSGGSTPRALFSLLAGPLAAQVPWQKIIFFWGDERHVPPDHSDSNYRMANEALLSKVPVLAENIYRVHAENANADAAALAYEQDLRKAFHLSPGEIPRFDLIHLGIGPDGHTASLFPSSQALNERNRLVVANWVEKFKTHRITFTYPVLNASAYVTFLAAGKDKAEAVHGIVDNGENLPASLVQPENGRLVWFLDRAARGSDRAA